MSLPPNANMLLIDGVLHPDAKSHLFQHAEPLEITPLYRGTRWDALQDLGPLLVAFRGSPILAGDIYQDACWLASDAPLRSVADHLRLFVAPPDVRGFNGLLRFADPVVARHWLGSYEGDHLNAILGPIDAWHMPNNRHTWEPETSAYWQSYVRSAAAPDGVNALLGESQLQALDKAARWRFMEDLNSHFEYSHPHLLAQRPPSTRAQRFEHNLAQAQAWGLSGERSLAIWIEYSLRWGDDFTLQADGPYQRWLANTPNALKLAPELRIQQMDNDCLDIELNKEA